MPANSQRIDQSDIDAANTISLADIARERGLVLKKSGLELVGPCPHCGGRDRFAISPGKNLFNCRGCGVGDRGAIAFVCWLDGCGFREAVELLIGRRSAPIKSRNLRNVPAKNSADDAAERARTIEGVGRIWRASVDPRGTLAENYLNGRGLDLPDDLRGRVLRFHPSCPWGDGRVPALIAAFHPITEPNDDAMPVAIMRVGLNADGTKIAKKMLAAVAACAIKLDADDSVSHGLGIAEGLETALAVRATGWRPVWALGSAGAIEKFPPLAGVEALTIFADNDESGRGIQAARACAARWNDAGAETFIRLPRNVGADWADTP